jgi:DNA-binding transcriptional MocR family regulator
VLAYVPVNFELYRSVSAHLRWTLQCLIGFADKTGRCFPSVRKLAEVTGISKSTVSRHLQQLARSALISRERRPGGVYRYQVDARFLPLSHARKTAVPRAPTEEYPIKKTGDSPLLDDERWPLRLQGWQKSRFWLPQWGPKPNEAGCFAPVG